VSGHVHVSKVQQEGSIWYVSSPSLDVYPCAYRIFRVTPENITIETYQINYPALIKKAMKNMEESTLAYKFDQSRPERFLAVLDGERMDKDVLLPLAAGGVAQPLAKKKKKKAKPDKTAKPKKEEKAPEKKPEPKKKPPEKKRGEKKPVETKPAAPEKPEADKAPGPAGETPAVDTSAGEPETGKPKDTTPESSSPEESR
jgi:outer membrane biosynthesis protein TonB